jgi:hypothetical protein
MSRPRAAEWVCLLFLHSGGGEQNPRQARRAVVDSLGEAGYRRASGCTGLGGSSECTASPKGLVSLIHFPRQPDPDHSLPGGKLSFAPLSSGFRDDLSQARRIHRSRMDPPPHRRTARPRLSHGADTGARMGRGAASSFPLSSMKKHSASSRRRERNSFARTGRNRVSAPEPPGPTKWLRDSSLRNEKIASPLRSYPSFQQRTSSSSPHSWHGRCCQSKRTRTPAGGRCRNRKSGGARRDETRRE